MGKCSYCGILSNNKEKVTLHKFPRNETLCKRWIKILDREGWVPTKSSFMCSNHFTEDCFSRYEGGRIKKILIPGKVPTILSNNSNCEQQKSDNYLTERNCVDVVEDTFSTNNIEIVHEPIIKVEHTNLMNNTEKFNEENQGIPVFKCKKNLHFAVTLHEKILHDHQYEQTPQIYAKNLQSLRKRLDLSLKENKMLRQQVGRLKKKITLLQFNGTKRQITSS